MTKGIIINNVSNMYQVEFDKKIINCNARGKLKKEEITPVVGDIVKIEIIDEEKKLGIINKIEKMWSIFSNINISTLLHLNIINNFFHFFFHYIPFIFFTI